VRIAFQARFGIANADLIEQFDRTPARLGFTHALVQRQDFADLLFDRVHRIERAHRLLEDHGHIVAAHLTHRGFVGLHQVDAVEFHGPRRMARRGIGQKFQDGQSRHRFAGPGFADDGNRFAPVDIERDLAHGMGHLAGDGEIDGQVPDRQQRPARSAIFGGMGHGAGLT